MTHVIDASFIMSFLLPDEKKPLADEIFNRFIKQELILIAPILLQFEVLNGLKMAIRRKRVSKEKAVQLMQLFLNYRIEYAEVELKEVFNIAINKKITVYDASYVYLSHKNKFPLLTLDKHLQEL